VIDIKIQAELESYIVEINESKAIALLKKCLGDGLDPLQLLKVCQLGMRKVGERYENKEYFISGLIMGGEIFRLAMEAIKPYIRERMEQNSCGSVLLGTVAGDIHDLGKDMVSELLVCHGFQVQDLGVDVPAHRFLEAAVKEPPNIIGMSILITPALDSMKETIHLLKKEAPPRVSKLPIIIGGSLTNDDVRAFSNADYWVNDAMDGVRLCQKLLRAHPPKG
jgi:methanogenic corrinoid protein MtbC1